MPRISDKIKIEVRPESSNGMREYHIKVSVPEEALSFSDLLAKRGGIKALEPELQEVIRDAISAYVKAGDGFVKEAIGLKQADSTPRRGRKKSVNKDPMEVNEDSYSLARK